jgi:hypothetical protein
MNAINAMGVLLLPVADGNYGNCMTACHRCLGLGNTVLHPRCNQFVTPHHSLSRVYCGAWVGTHKPSAGWCERSMGDSSPACFQIPNITNKTTRCVARDLTPPTPSRSNNECGTSQNAARRRLSAQRLCDLHALTYIIITSEITNHHSSIV